MTQKVLFNGAVLIRAGGATRVDASAYQNLGLGGIGVVGIIGEADGGLPNTAQIFRTPQDIVNAYRAGPIADAADLAFRPMNDPRVPGGADQVVVIKTNQSVQSALVLKRTLVAEINLLAKDYGAHTNKISFSQSTSGAGKVVGIKFEDGTRAYQETSPVLGGTAEFTIKYNGAGSAASATITKTKLTTAVTGAPGDNLDLSFSTYSTLKELINAINVAAGGVYTAVAVTTNPYTFNCTDLDRLAITDIRTSAASAYAQVFRIVSWINSNSSWISATRADGLAAEGDLAPDDTVGYVPLASGARGISSNTDWQNAFNAMGAQRVNQVVPLASEDLTNLGQGSTATFASIVAAADSHVAFYSSTKGKSERQCFVGMKGTKTAVLAQAGTLQSPHTVLTSQSIKRPDAVGNMAQFPEWGLAVIMAGGRAGSLLGEPLVYKNIRAYGLSQDASWNPNSDGEDLILGGVTFAFNPPNQGYKFDRVITTYTKLDNDAYVEESVVQGWKTVSYGLRTQLENIFTGVRGLPATIQGIVNAADRILSQYRQEGQIVDSILADGTTLRAYRELQVVLDGDIARLSVIISPVSGINFQLNTLFLVPATIAA